MLHPGAVRAAGALPFVDDVSVRSRWLSCIGAAAVHPKPGAVESHGLFLQLRERKHAREVAANKPAASSSGSGAAAPWRRHSSCTFSARIQRASAAELVHSHKHNGLACQSEAARL